MTSQRDRAGRSQRDEVEDILAFVPGATAAETDALVALFAATAGPISPGELAGEAAAVAAFRAAQAPAAVPSRTAKLRATVLTAKAAVAALVLTSVGGVALAATTDVLPAPLTIGHEAKPSKPGDGRGSADGIADAAQTAAVRDAAKAAAAADRAAAKAGRESSFAGLCQAFTAGAGDNAKAAGNPAFSRLVTAAPAGDVSGFCTALATEAANTKNPGAGKDKSADAREKAADNGKVPAKPEQALDPSAEAREKAAGNGKAADNTADKTADKTADSGTPKGAKNDAPRGNNKTAEDQRSQLSR